MSLVHDMRTALEDILVFLKRGSDMGTTPLWLSWNSSIDPKNETGVEHNTTQAQLYVPQQFANDERTELRSGTPSVSLVSVTGALQADASESGLLNSLEKLSRRDDCACALH